MAWMSIKYLVRPGCRVCNLFQPWVSKRPELAHTTPRMTFSPWIFRPGTYHPTLFRGTLAPGLTPARRLTTIAPKSGKRGIRHDAARGRDRAGRGARAGDSLHLGEGAARRLQGARSRPGRSGRSRPGKRDRLGRAPWRSEPHRQLPGPARHRPGRPCRGAVGRAAREIDRGGNLAGRCCRLPINVE